MEANLKKYRNNGAIGALLDEYERALEELFEAIVDVSPEFLIRILDDVTEDEDCRSIQSILTHVVQSGYTYIVEIRKGLGESVDYREKEFFGSIEEYQVALSLMFEYTEKLFLDHANITLEEFNNDKKMKVRWGQSYDVEQLMEHAIVHILRHRRQIERFISKSENQ